MKSVFYRAVYLLTLLCILNMRKSSAMISRTRPSSLMGRTLLRRAIVSDSGAAIPERLSDVLSPSMFVPGAYVQLKTGETCVQSLIRG